MTDIIIRTITAADKSEWLRMRKDLWPKDPPEQLLSEMDQILHSPGIVLGAETSDRKLVGFAEVSIRNEYVEGSTGNPTGYIEGLEVDESCRQQGIGRQLLLAAEKWCKDQGLAEIGSDTDLKNLKSLRVHQSAGFKVAASSMNFIKKIGERKAAGPVTSPIIGVVIRPADFSDIDRISSFDQMAIQGTARVKLIENWVGQRQALVLEYDKQVVGYAALEYTFFSCGFLAMLYFDEAYRQRGLGRLFMQYLEDRCVTPKLFTSANQSNSSMRKLLTKRGFVPSGMVNNLDEGDSELLYFKMVKRTNGLMSR
jgi:GNAT superfamily N-acetyltransferase